jgi:hypothetical protein
MRRLRLLLATLHILALLVVPATAHAVDVLENPCTTASGSTLCAGNQDQRSNNQIFGPNGLLTKAARFMAMLVGIASVVMILIGGFKYVTSSGDPGNIKSAKDTILFAVVGILVAVSAQSIVVFVLSRL